MSCFYHGGLQTTPVIDGLECHCKDPCETISAMECDKSFECCSFGRSSIQRSPILQKTHPHLFLGVSWESLVSFVMGAGMNIRTFRMIIYIPRLPRHANTSVYFGGQTPAFSAGVWMSRRHVFLLPLGFLSSLSAHCQPNKKVGAGRNFVVLVLSLPVNLPTKKNTTVLGCPRS